MSQIGVISERTQMLEVSNVDLSYKLIWPLRYMKAPVSFDHVVQNSIPKNSTYSSHLTGETIRITFFGDLMGIGDATVEVGEQLAREMKKSDKIIINLESVLINESGPILANQYTYPDSFASLAMQLDPKKLIVGLANNHFYDFGKTGVTSTLSTLDILGIEYFGTKTKPLANLAPGLSVLGSTLWKSSYDHFVHTGLSSIGSDKLIQFIHWGDEFTKFPKEAQRKYFSSNNMFMTVGHHSHTPQEINYENGKLCAYSLGNFLTATCSEKINSGIMFNVTLSFNDDGWNLVESQWDFIDIQVNGKNVHVEIKS